MFKVFLYTKHFNILLKNLGWIKYLSPLVGIILSPVTILFLWAVWTGPLDSEVPNEINELLVHYDAFYANNSRNKLDEKAVTTPLPFPVEFYPPFQELISRKQRLFESIK